MRLDFEILKNFAQKNNMIIGACRAAPIDSERLTASPFVPFVSGSLEKRVNPEATLRGVKSVVVIGVGWSVEDCAPAGGNFEEHHESLARGSLESFATGRGTSPPSQARVRLSSLGTCDDYHKRVKDLLRQLVAELSQTGQFMYKIIVDGVGLDERALAHRAGLGFYGRNGLIISEKFGSRFNIGCLLTGLELPDDKVEFSPVIAGLTCNLFPGRKPEIASKSCNDGTCGAQNFLTAGSHLKCPPDCNLCISACPTGALKSDGGLNAARCISYLSQKNTLTDEEEKLLASAGQLYGCDICTDICPFNGGSPPAGVFVNPRRWLEMTDEDFQKKYGHTAMLWRGAEILRRNARISEKIETGVFTPVFL